MAITIACFATGLTHVKPWGVIGRGDDMRLFLGFFALIIAAIAQAAPPTGSITDFIDRQMPVSGAPGLAYAIVKDGTIQSGARGEVLIGSGTGVTADTPFVLGSISKSFTALAVMQFVEAGKVDLDTEISQYLNVFSGRPSGAVTIRQLLSHTSGFSTVQGNQMHSQAAQGDDVLFRQVERIAGWDLAYPPESRWEYSNANYLILGSLIETMSGQDFAGYIETEILGPLGMVSSFVSDGQAYDIMAVPHRPWFWTKRAMIGRHTDRLSAPAGGIIASANDVALYLAAMMNGEDDIISAESKAAMMRPASDASPFYGFGWFLDASDGSASHDGTSPGVETLAVLIPAQNKAVVTLVNAGSGVGFGETSELRMGISARALGFDYQEEGSRWSQKTLFASLVLLPILFLISIIWAWVFRDKLRAKSGPFGLFSLWFPLLTTLGMGWAFLFLGPKLFGVSMDTLLLFQPDLAMAMIATSATGALWAIFRLGLAYSGSARAG